MDMDKNKHARASQRNDKASGVYKTIEIIHNPRGGKIVHASMAMLRKIVRDR